MWRSSRSGKARCLVLAAVLLMLASPVASQVPPAADSARSPWITGEVRVRAPSIAKFRIVGTVDRAPPDTLVVRGLTRAGVDTIWTLPVAAISRLQVVHGTHSNAGKGLGYGLLGGGLAGAGIGALSCKEPGNLLGSEGCAKVLGVLGAGAGAIVGLIVGATSRSDTWIEARVPALRVSFNCRSEGGGLRLGATVAFRPR